MGAVVEQYPINPDTDPLIPGDDITLGFRVRRNGVDQDITTWTFQAQGRQQAGSDLLLTFVCMVDPDDDARLLLTLSPTESAKMVNGFTFDIQQLTPIVRTIFSAKRTRVQAQVTR